MLRLLIGSLWLKLFSLVLSALGVVVRVWRFNLTSLMTASSTTLSAKSYRRLLLPLVASFGVENERHVDADEAAATSTHRGRALITVTDSMAAMTCVRGTCRDTEHRSQGRVPQVQSPGLTSRDNSGIRT
mmetsp:Transcript_20447/g.46211  ORF Transcript_20447/g.46211 Transcript_20447/m.46211 type:complete len:130 (-) Transcript_20447:128-517(-)